MLERHGVDYEFGAEGLDFFLGSEPLRVVHEAQPLGVGVEDRRLVVETKDICKERAHLAGSEDKYAHGVVALFLIHQFNLLAHAFFVNILKDAFHKFGRHAAEHALRAALVKDFVVAARLHDGHVVL